MGRARAVAIHILLDNFVMVFLYVALMMAVTSLLEGRILTFIPEMKEGYFTAVRASMQVSLLGYAPVEFMSFYSLPRNLRVLAVSVSACRLCSSGPYARRVQSGWRIEPDSRHEFTLDFVWDSQAQDSLFDSNLLVTLLALMSYTTSLGECDGRGLGCSDELRDAQEQALRIELTSLDSQRRRIE